MIIIAIPSIITEPSPIPRDIASMMDDMMIDEFKAIITAIFVAVFLIFLVMAMPFPLFCLLSCSAFPLS